MPNVYISLGVHGFFRDAPTTLIPSSDTSKQIFMLSPLSDFVVCGANLYIWCSGVYI